MPKYGYQIEGSLFIEAKNIQEARRKRDAALFAILNADTGDVEWEGLYHVGDPIHLPPEER